MKKILLKDYSLLAISIIVYSCTSICNKFASEYPLFSLKFILFYGLSIVVLGVYAVLWQQVLKNFELSVAYAAKPLSTLLSMMYGVVLFHEEFTATMVIGTVIILIGIYVVVSDRGK